MPSRFASFVQPLQQGISSFRRLPAWRIISIELLVALLILEAGARLQGFAPAPANDSILNPHTYWQNRPNFVYERGTRTDCKVTISHNELGFRDEPMPLQKPAGEKRIVCLGDSTTYGYGVEFEAMYTERWEDRLGPPWRVVSAGVPGYTSFQGLQQLRHGLLELEPDLLTAAFNYNDRRYVLDPAGKDDKEYFRRTVCWRQILDRFTARSALAVGLLNLAQDTHRRKYRQDTPPIEVLEPRVPLQRYKDNLRAVASIAKERHIPLIFIGTGDSFEMVKGLEQYRQTGDLSEKMHALDSCIYHKNYAAYLVASKLYARLMDDPKAADVLACDGRTETPAEMKRLILGEHLPILSTHGGYPVEPDWIYREAMEDVAKETGTPYLDFVRTVKQNREIASGVRTIYQINDEVHLNEEGHRLLADALWDEWVKDFGGLAMAP